jgi:hypothetical protein
MTFLKALAEVGVNHQIATPYHPQTSGQTETSNKQIKKILQMTGLQIAKDSTRASIGVATQDLR